MKWQNKMEKAYFMKYGPGSPFGVTKVFKKTAKQQQQQKKIYIYIRSRSRRGNV